MCLSPRSISLLRHVATRAINSGCNFAQRPPVGYMHYYFQLQLAEISSSCRRRTILRN
jgi:hypothetical protein